MPTRNRRRETCRPCRPPQLRWAAATWIDIRYLSSHLLSCLSPHGGSLACCGALLGSIPKSVRALGAVLAREAQLTDEVRRKVGECGTLQEQRHRGFHAKVSANGVPDSHRHQRIHTQFSQRLARLDG